MARAGRYEVRLSYSAHGNRASNVPVSVRSRAGEKRILVDQRRPAPIDGAFLSLGVFDFERGRTGHVEISNDGTDGYVIVDAIQLVPVP
jgi:hypothetical protein